MSDEFLAALQYSSFTSNAVLELLPRTELIEHLKTISNFQISLIQAMIERKEIDLDSLERYVDKFSEMTTEAETILATHHRYKTRYQEQESP